MHYLPYAVRVGGFQTQQRFPKERIDGGGCGNAAARNAITGQTVVSVHTYGDLSEPTSPIRRRPIKVRLNGTNIRNSGHDGSCASAVSLKEIYF
jgi:hypothetical protein